MWEYIKFWLAQAVADLFILVIIFGMIMSIWFGFSVYCFLRDKK